MTNPNMTTPSMTSGKVPLQKMSIRTRALAGLLIGAAMLIGTLPAYTQGRNAQPFQIVETSIDDIHAAIKAGRLTVRQLVQGYLDRIETYDKRGPNINSVITINPDALAEADKRALHGSKGSTVFRDPTEENRMWVVFDWDEQGWANFVSDPEVPPILKEAGHLGKPQTAPLLGQYRA